MFDITKEINSHLAFLKETLASFSAKDRCFFSAWCIKVTLKLPNALEAINCTYNLNITQLSLLEDILSARNIESYTEAIQHHLDKLDEYAEDFDESDELKVFALTGFEQCILGIGNSAHLVYAAENIINILDFYEQLSDDSKYWNNLLEKEVVAQKQVVTAILEHAATDIDSHHTFYEDVHFKWIA